MSSLTVDRVIAEFLQHGRVRRMRFGIAAAIPTPSGCHVWRRGDAPNLDRRSFFVAGKMPPKPPTSGMLRFVARFQGTVGNHALKYRSSRHCKCGISPSASRVSRLRQSQNHVECIGQEVGKNPATKGKTNHRPRSSESCRGECACGRARAPTARGLGSIQKRGRSCLEGLDSRCCFVRPAQLHSVRSVRPREPAMVGRPPAARPGHAATPTVVAFRRASLTVTTTSVVPTKATARVALRIHARDRVAPVA